MSSSDIPSPDNEAQFEASIGAFTPEERCLTELFDMADVGKVGAYQATSDFFVALNGYPATSDLRTNIHVSRFDSDESMFGTQVFPDGMDVVATVSVGFEARAGDTRGLHNIDFVRTDEGLSAFEKAWFFEGDERVPRYVRQLDEAQLSALAADAKTIAQVIMDTDMERLKLGPLAEEAGPDGLRRFHIGDILSVITDRLLSPRGVEGLYDILGYMTDDESDTTQLVRFADECKPYLRQQFDEMLEDFYEPPAEALTDVPSIYRWLCDVTRDTGEPLLTVKPIPEEQHARIDVGTELILDYGQGIMKKVITFDTENPPQL